MNYPENDLIKGASTLYIINTTSKHDLFHNDIALLQNTHWLQQKVLPLP